MPRAPAGYNVDITSWFRPSAVDGVITEARYIDFQHPLIDAQGLSDARAWLSRHLNGRVLTRVALVGENLQVSFIDDNGASQTENVQFDRIFDALEITAHHSENFGDVRHAASDYNNTGDIIGGYLAAGHYIEVSNAIGEVNGALHADIPGVHGQNARRFAANERLLAWAGDSDTDRQIYIIPRSSTDPTAVTNFPIGNNPPGYQNLQTIGMHFSDPNTPHNILTIISADQSNQDTGVVIQTIDFNDDGTTSSPLNPVTNSHFTTGDDLALDAPLTSREVIYGAGNDTHIFLLSYGLDTYNRPVTNVNTYEVSRGYPRETGPDIFMGVSADVVGFFSDRLYDDPRDIVITKRYVFEYRQSLRRLIFPTSYPDSGSALIVNADEDALEFTSPSGVNQFLSTSNAVDANGNYPVSFQPATSIGNFVHHIGSYDLNDDGSWTDLPANTESNWDWLRVIPQTFPHNYAPVWDLPHAYFQNLDPFTSNDIDAEVSAGRARPYSFMVYPGNTFTIALGWNGATSRLALHRKPDAQGFAPREIGRADNAPIPSDNDAGDLYSTNIAIPPGELFLGISLGRNSANLGLRSVVYWFPASSLTRLDATPDNEHNIRDGRYLEIGGIIGHSGADYRNVVLARRSNNELLWGVQHSGSYNASPFILWGSGPNRIIRVNVFGYGRR